MLLGRPYVRSAKVLPTTEAVVEAVRGDPNAIGYGGIGYAHGVVPCTIDGVAPTAANVRNGTYPIARYLYLYTAEPPQGVIQEFVDWVLETRASAWSRTQATSRSTAPRSSEGLRSPESRRRVVAVRRQRSGANLLFKRL